MPDISSSTSSRLLYQILAWCCVALGILGAFLPVLPTTIFIIIAAWAFSRSSDHWHQWLREHSKFGKTLCAWEDHRAMPKKAKYIAFITLILSYCLTAFILGPFSPAAIMAGICMSGVVIYIAYIPVLTPEQLEQKKS